MDSKQYRRDGVKQMTIKRHTVDGFTISAIRGGYLVNERYIGYTIREAKRLFIDKYGRE